MAANPQDRPRRSNPPGPFALGLPLGAQCRKAAAIVSIALLAACQAVPPEEPAGQHLESQADSAASVALPLGEFRVAGADGAAIDLPHAITMSISEEEITLVSGCVRRRWSNPRSANTATFEASPQASCRRALFPSEVSIFAVLDDLGSVRQTPENGWVLEGGGHSITLFSQ
ncbi:MAG: hypothetical protein WA936_05930 [Erythrobacter sp.]